MSCGIYCIKNKKNGKKYIGSSYDTRKRIYEHKRILNLNRHHSIVLQRAWNKYGQSCFTFFVIERCKKKNLLKREQYYLDKYNPDYNIAKIAGNCSGIKRTPRQIKKLSTAHLGQVPWNKGIPQTIKQKKAHSIKMKGRPSGAKGIIWSEYSRKKLSKSLTGRSLSEKHKKKLSKKIISINRYGMKTKYNSITEASKATGVKISNISTVCRGLRNKAGGMEWRFV